MAALMTPIDVLTTCAKRAGASRQPCNALSHVEVGTCANARAATCLSTRGHVLGYCQALHFAQAAIAPADVSAITDGTCCTQLAQRCAMQATVTPSRGRVAEAANQPHLGVYVDFAEITSPGLRNAG